MSVTLNGTIYSDADFTGYGYVDLFPEAIFTDLLAEIADAIAQMQTLLSSAQSIEGIAAGADGEFLIVSGGVWTSIDIETYLNGANFALDADNVAAGSFAAGDYVFPGNLSVTGNLAVGGTITATGSITADSFFEAV